MELKWNKLPDVPPPAHEEVWIWAPEYQSAPTLAYWNGAYWVDPDFNESDFVGGEIDDDVLYWAYPCLPESSAGNPATKASALPIAGVGGAEGKQWPGICNHPHTYRENGLDVCVDCGQKLY